MNRKVDLPYIQHIRDAVLLIEKWTKDKNLDDFMTDEKLNSAVIRQLEIIGEAVRNLPQDFREIHNSINWQNPADMRSVLIHGYLNVDIDIVWDTIIHDLPPFKKQIENLLKNLKE